MAKELIDELLRPSVIDLMEEAALRGAAAVQADTQELRDEVLLAVQTCFAGQIAEQAAKERARFEGILKGVLDVYDSLGEEILEAINNGSIAAAGPSCVARGRAFRDLVEAGHLVACAAGD